jgi:hypothetical protein
VIQKLALLTRPWSFPDPNLDQDKWSFATKSVSDWRLLDFSSGVGKECPPHCNIRRDMGHLHSSTSYLCDLLETPPGSLLFLILPALQARRSGSRVKQIQTPSPRVGTARQ